MNLATKKWIFLKISSVILLPLMFWFIINFVKVYDNEYLDVVKFFTNPVSKFLFSLFIIFAYFFSISEVFEDYITDDKIKYVANRLLFISAIIIPLLTIIFLFNLN